MSKKTINPVYSPKDSTFDFPIHLSLADKLGVLELILWDKDMLMKKEYLGEAALPLEDWFREGDNGRIYAWEDAPVRFILLLAVISQLTMIRSWIFHLFRLVRSWTPGARCKSDLDLSSCLMLKWSLLTYSRNSTSFQDHPSFLLLL